MKELAEQAATGTYTTAQREIINSEYQAMAAEIDRIANATNFNGIKLLDGSVTNQHGGQGLKIHFGVSNKASEDYYFVNIGDARATSSTGLRIGGDAKNDIWGQGAAGSGPLAGPGCCTAGYGSLDGKAGFVSGETFSYGYNWDWTENSDSALLTGRYLAGRYTVGANDSLQDLVNKVNDGTQSRVGVALEALGIQKTVASGGTVAVCVGDEAYVFGSAKAAGGTQKVDAIEGAVYNYLAEGSYSGEGFMFNNAVGYGFGLTQAQITRLTESGLDLTALNLQSAIVNASASSTSGSAQARNSLTAKLSQAWNALNLGDLSGLSTQAGVNTGYSITSSTLLASATSDILSGVGEAATIVSGQTVQVHTGVYADKNGNWTDNKDIASALQLKEVVFSIQNDGLAHYDISMAPGGFKSQLYVVSAASNLAILNTDAIAMGLAGLDDVNFVSASIDFSASIVGEGNTLASAQADYYDKISGAWAAKYSTIAHQLDFQTDAPAAASVTLTATQIGNNAPAGVLDANTANGKVINGQTLTIDTGLYIDQRGNWTSSQSIADTMTAAGHAFEKMVYTVTGTGGNLTFGLTIGGNTESLATTPSLATDTANVTNIVDAIDTDIAAILTALRTGNEGSLTYIPTGSPSSLFKPSLSEATNTNYSNIVPTAPSNYLTASVELAGDKIELTPGTGALNGLARNTTTIGSLVAKTSQALEEVLKKAQLDAVVNDNFTNMGRLVKSSATPAAGPTSSGEVDGLTESELFVSGTLDRSVASGGFSISGYLTNSALGLTLSSAQRDILVAAGLNLNKLQLISADPSVKASAVSSLSSAEARQLLLDKINQIWDDLKLFDRNSLEIASGVSGGFTDLDFVSVVASAQTGVLTGTGATATLNEQTSFIVHTGVYADANGNWTDDKDLASALGLNEISYKVENNDYTWLSASAKVDGNYVISASFSLSSAMMQLMSAANIDLPAGFVSASAYAMVSAHGSVDDISAALTSSVKQVWDNKYANVNFEAISFRVTNANIIQDLTAAQVTASGYGVVTGYDDAAQMYSGKTMNVHTGIWADADGNFTYDKDIASAFGFDEIIYTLTTNTAGAVAITASGPTGYSPTISTAPAGTSIGVFRADISTDIRATLNGLQSSGQGFLNKKAAAPLELTNEQIWNANTFASTQGQINTGVGGVYGFLDVSINFAGNDSAIFTSPALVSSTDIDTLAQVLSTNIGNSIAQHQTDATSGSNPKVGVGLIRKANLVAPNGPATEADIKGLSFKDFYKAAASDSFESTIGIVDKSKYVTMVATIDTSSVNNQGISNFGAWALASAINHNADSQFWAMVQSFDSNGKTADMVYIFTKDGGNFNDLLACDVAGSDSASRSGLDAINFENVATTEILEDGTTFTLGGEKWATMKPTQTKASLGNEVWNVTLNGRDVGKERDIWIANANEVKTPALDFGVINGMNRDSFVEIQNAADSPWAGGEVRTQSAAQAALDAITESINTKDKIRADLGALQNRLENTMTNLTVQAENLQASESRISDVDVATEMTEFTRNNVLAQAATSMLAQANSLSQLALSLIG
jgi:flagellin-like hook-associated protein FlgL